MTRVSRLLAEIRVMQDRLAREIEIAEMESAAARVRIAQLTSALRAAEQTVAELTQSGEK